MLPKILWEKDLINISVLENYCGHFYFWNWQWFFLYYFLSSGNKNKGKITASFISLVLLLFFFLIIFCGENEKGIKKEKKNTKKGE